MKSSSPRRSHTEWDRNLLQCRVRLFFFIYFYFLPFFPVPILPVVIINSHLVVCTIIWCSWGERCLFMEKIGWWFRCVCVCCCGESHILPWFLDRLNKHLNLKWFSMTMRHTQRKNLPNKKQLIFKFHLTPFVSFRFVHTHPCKPRFHKPYHF